MYTHPLSPNRDHSCILTKMGCWLNPMNQCLGYVFDSRFFSAEKKDLINIISLIFCILNEEGWDFKKTVLIVLLL